MTPLQTIREAVFKSIPGIEYRWADYDSPNTETTAAMIGLADVLRAIKSNKRLSAKKWFEAVDFLVARAQWNLAKNLDEQDEPTLKFLAEILK